MVSLNCFCPTLVVMGLTAEAWMSYVCWLFDTFTLYSPSLEPFCQDKGFFNPMKFRDWLKKTTGLQVSCREACEFMAWREGSGKRHSLVSMLKQAMCRASVLVCRRTRNEYDGDLDFDDETALLVTQWRIWREELQAMHSGFDGAPVHEEPQNASREVPQVQLLIKVVGDVVEATVRERPAVTLRLSFLRVGMEFPDAARRATHWMQRVDFVDKGQGVLMIDAPDGEWRPVELGIVRSGSDAFVHVTVCEREVRVIEEYVIVELITGTEDEDEIDGEEMHDIPPALPYVVLVSDQERKEAISMAAEHIATYRY